jgi:thiol-disulfide isomerase/thioredoxin
MTKGSNVGCPEPAVPLEPVLMSPTPVSASAECPAHPLGSSRMARNRTRLLSLTAAVALTLAACGGSDGGTGAAVSSANNSSDGISFTAATLGGDTIDSGSLEGTDTVLWFWAPWCTICRGEGPGVAATAEKFGDEVKVIGVAGRGEVGDMKSFVSDTETGSLTHVVDDSGSIWANYGVSSQPAFAFVNDDGTIRVFTGAMGEAGLEAEIQQLIDT